MFWHCYAYWPCHAVLTCWWLVVLSFGRSANRGIPRETEEEETLGETEVDWKTWFYKGSMWFIHGIINPPKMLIEKVSRFLKDDIICSNWWGLKSFQTWWNMSVHLSTQIVFATLLGPILACAYEDDARVHAGDAASSVLWASLGGAKNVVSSPYYREHCSGAALFWFRVCLDLSFWTMGTPIHQSVGPTRIFIATWWAFHVGVGEAFTGALVSL